MRAKTSLFIGFMAFLALTIAATPSHSQAPSDEDEFVLEDTIVTATKREESIQDIPISVTAFSGQQVRDLGYTNTIDIAQQTPGFNVIQFHPTLTALNIRGISQNEFTDYFEAPIAAYVDDAYVANQSSLGVQMFDIERVEVLRGPQGTLFGRNATGGLVHYVSAAPTEEFHAYGGLTYGNYQTVRFEGVVSGSLGENVQARLSGTVHKNDGLLENDIGPDMQQTDVYALRLQLAWQPTESTDVRLKFHHSKDDPDSGHAYQHAAATQNEHGLGVKLPPGTPDWNGYADTDGDVWRGAYDEIGFFRREINGATLRINADLSPQTTLTSITDYNDTEKSYWEDSDGSPFPYFAWGTTQDYTQFSQELRLNSENENLRWQAGLYYLDMENDTSSYYELDYFPFGAGTDFGQVVNRAGYDTIIDTRSWAVFGEGEYDFTEELALTLGLRYTEDERDLDVAFTDIFSPYPPGNPRNATDTIEFDNWSYRAVLNWRPNDGTLLFAGVNQTHKAGNFRLALGINEITMDFNRAPHDEEVLLSYEMGIKRDLMAGRLRLNANAFYYDYEGYQAFVVDPTSSIIAAVDILNHDAEAYGGELEVSAIPMKGLNVVLGVAVMDSTVKDVTFYDLSVGDTELPFAPAVTVNGLVRYAWGVANGEASIQFDFNYTDDFSFSALNPPLDHEDSYFVGNVRASYTFPNERWSITAFATNVFEEEYRVYSLDVSGLGLIDEVYANQRLFGVTVEYTWN